MNASGILIMRHGPTFNHATGKHLLEQCHQVLQLESAQMSGNTPGINLQESVRYNTQDHQKAYPESV